VAERQLRTVITLGSAQTLAWASSFYLPAMLAVPMARDTGVSVPTVFLAFSVSMVLSAMLGPAAGRLIDRIGGRPVLIGTNLIFAIGLAALASVQGPIGLFAAWLVLGIGMGSGLYDAAFATLVRLYGRGARDSITGITLIAGFASTVGWPLTTLFDAQFGWRGACLAWAAAHLLIGLPLNLSLPRARQTGADDAPPVAPGPQPHVELQPEQTRRATLLLSFAFATTYFVATSMATHLPRLLQATGASLAAAVTAGALVGPAQVGARMLEYGFLRRMHPLFSARLATLMHPVGAVILMVIGAPAAAAFTILHGAGNGILTITKGTLPLALFGAAGYGQRQGLLLIPARVAQAAAPWLFGLCLDRFGAGVLWLSGALWFSAFVALALLPREKASHSNEASAVFRNSGA
jgi:predicted MFS family arabinose efflux permease